MSEPIVVSAGNTSHLKLTAALELCRAVHELSKVLSSVNVRVRVENNVIQVPNGGIGINVEQSTDISNSERDDQYNAVFESNMVDSSKQ